MPERNDPIDNITWVGVDSLVANNWNPNVVFNAELRLLEHSILSDGWLVPIIINRNNIIIDGFHRYSLALNSKKLRQKYGDEVPCVVLDIPDREAMLSTVRLNRAKGTHVAVRMSALVKRLIDDHGYTEEELTKELGATPTEIKLLYDGSLLKSRDLSNAKYSKAWVPVETTELTEQEVAAIKANNDRILG